jgi:hypothetical protein
MKTRNKNGKKAWYNKIPWLFCLGSILIFASWLLQNHLQSTWLSEKNYLDTTQLLISIEEGHMTEWLIYRLQEQSKPNPDSAILGTCSLKYIQHSANILTWAATRITDQANNRLSLPFEKQQLFDKAVNWYRHGDFAHLIALADSMTKHQNKFGPDLIQKHNEKYVNVVQAEERSNFWFFWAYFIGTFLVGFDFIKSKLLPNDQAYT